MQYNTLISDITSDIYSNGSELITGDILQGVLLDMVSAWAGAGAVYGGVINPSSPAPADLDQATVYLALTAGTYTNFLDSSNNPIVTTGPALINFDGGATLVFSKTDLPSGGGALSFVWDGNNYADCYLDIALDSQKGAFRIDLSAAYSQDDTLKFVGSLIIGINYDGANYNYNAYYYGDDIADILGGVEIYDDDGDAHLVLTANTNNDNVVFTIYAMDDTAFSASLVDTVPGTLEETVSPTILGSGGGGSNEQTIDGTDVSDILGIPINGACVLAICTLGDSPSYGIVAVSEVEDLGGAVMITQGYGNIDLSSNVEIGEDSGGDTLLEIPLNGGSDTMSVVLISGTAPGTINSYSSTAIVTSNDSVAWKKIAGPIPIDTTTVSLGDTITISSLTPNILHKYSGGALGSLSVTALASPSDATIVNEYMIECELGASSTIAFPATLKWFGGSAPTISAGIWQFSIVDGCIVAGKFA